MAPANPREDTKGPAKQPKHWLDYATFVIEIMGLVGLAIYACLTYGIWSANKIAAIAAKDAADSTRQALIASNRSWIEIGFASPWDTFGSNQLRGKLNALQLPLKYTNIGNSPAKNLRIYAAIEVLGGRQSPTLTFKEGSVIDTFTTPITYPHRSFPLIVTKRKPENNPVPIPEPVDSTLKKEFELGTKYMVIFANGTWSDQFGDHWFRYCTAVVLADHTVGYPDKNCSDYNDTGDNPTK